MPYGAIAKKIAGYFPPPRFLEMPAVGLSFTEQHVRFVELIRSRSGFRIGRYGKKILPPGAIAGGYVADKETVKAALRELKNEHKIEFVNASLPEEKAYLFRTKIPKAEGADLGQMVEFKIEENAPIASSEAVFDYVVLNGEDRKSSHYDVSVSVLPRKVAEVYIEILREAGLTPLSFEIEAQAIANAVIRKSDEEVSLIVNVGETRTGLFIVERGIVQFTLTIPAGGGEITAALGKELSLAPADAEKIRRERGFTRNRKNIELFLPILEKTFAPLKNEMGKLLIYWQTHTPEGSAGKPIERIVLTGTDAGLAGLREYCAAAAHLAADLADVWQNAFSYDEYIPDIPLLESLSYAAPIGLALSSE